VTLRKAKVTREQLAQIRSETNALLDGMPDIQRPVTRGDCLPGGRCHIRPCPFVWCKHNLYCSVTSGGGLKLNFPDLEPWQMQHSCALDVADEGEHTLEEAGAFLNITRERVRQLQVLAFRKLRVVLLGLEET